MAHRRLGGRMCEDADIGRGVARQAVGGAGQRRLVGDLDRQHVDDAAAEDDDGAVADELHLLEFGGVEQDRLALAGEFAQQPVDLLLGADVDAARRVEAEHGAGVRGDPARDRHLLLVAAGQPLDLALRARVDLQPLDGALNRRVLAPAVDRAPVARTGR